MNYTNYQSLKLSNSKFITSIEAIRNYVSDVLSNSINIYYTDHSISHCERILKLIDAILCQNEEEDLLTECESYVLLASVFLHDIGMQNELAIQNIDERRDAHHKLTSETIKSNWREIGIEQDYVDIICLIAEGHRGDINEKYVDKIIGTDEIVRCDLLATILYLGDELDICHDRVDIKKLQFLKYNPASKFHLYKHYYTQGIAISDKKSIKITFRYPDRKTDQYDPLFNPFVVNKIKKAINNITSILQKKYAIIITISDEDICSEEVSSLSSIPQNDFDSIVSFNLGVKNFQILEKINFKEKIGDVNPELFYKGNVRWADIINDLDIKRDQYNEIRDSFNKLYDDACKNQKLNGLVICGEGGSGKTTLLRRFAYDLVKEKQYEDMNLLWQPVDSEFQVTELVNLHNTTLKPVIVFIDGINVSSTLIKQHLNSTITAKINFPMILIFAVRLNEWRNAGGETINFHKHKKILLNKLTDGEITSLLTKLDSHNQLYDLADLSEPERFEIFKSKAERQLLVAMLEATRGKKFKEIIWDEYKKIKADYYEAAKAYELICLFFYHDVLIPEELLITMVHCYRFTDFELKVLKYTYLVIIKHPDTRFGNLYKPRHKEIAKIIINNIDEYKIGTNRLNQVAIVLRQIDTNERNQRYVIINFLNNYVRYVIKNLPKNDYHDRMQEIRNFITENRKRINLIQEEAQRSKYVPELITWSRLFSELRMMGPGITCLEKIVDIDLYSISPNYKLANLLSRTRTASDNPERVANYYHNSFLGGNRKIFFLYEYLSFSLKHRLFNHVDNIEKYLISFTSYTQEEEELRIKIETLLRVYNIGKDKSVLIEGFSGIDQHIQNTKELIPADELAYIDLFESDDPKKALNDYLQFLLIIKPSRPRSILLRIAHTAMKVSGEEDTAIQYFYEVYKGYIKSDPQNYHFDIVFEYVKFAVVNNKQEKGLNYELFNLCKKLRPDELGLYSEYANYAYKNTDYPFVTRLAKQGLEIAKKYDKYHLSSVKLLERLLNITRK